MLVFDYRDSEADFFNNNHLDNFDIKFFKESLNEDTVKKLEQEHKDKAMVISVFVDSEVTEEVIHHFKNLRIITARSTGYDHINSVACQKRNISILNVANYGSTSVAQYTMGLILALERNIVTSAACLKGWEKTNERFVGRDLSKLTIGIVGTGAIGSAVCKLAHVFGMQILTYDLYPKHELTEKYNVQYVTLENLLKKSDVVTLHTPFTGDNKNMISYAQFSMMKSSAFIINTSRGEIVDICALKDALDTKKIKGAALDVLNCEECNLKCHSENISLDEIKLECVEDVRVARELVKYPNVIITPHIAYETQDAIDYILQCTFDGIIDNIKGGHMHRVF